MLQLGRWPSQARPVVQREPDGLEHAAWWKSSHETHTATTRPGQPHPTPPHLLPPPSHIQRHPLRRQPARPAWTPAGWPGRDLGGARRAGAADSAGAADRALPTGPSCQLLAPPRRGQAGPVGAADRALLAPPRAGPPWAGPGGPALPRAAAPSFLGSSRRSRCRLRSAAIRTPTASLRPPFTRREVPGRPRRRRLEPRPPGARRPAALPGEAPRCAGGDGGHARQRWWGPGPGTHGGGRALGAIGMRLHSGARWRRQQGPAGRRRQQGPAGRRRKQGPAPARTSVAPPARPPRRAWAKREGRQGAAPASAAEPAAGARRTRRRRPPAARRKHAALGPARNRFPWSGSGVLVGVWPTRPGGISSRARAGTPRQRGPGPMARRRRHDRKSAVQRPRPAVGAPACLQLDPR
jgi:hypothetical protein